jgi:hypothetical protein
MTREYRIHPAIGVARLGDSPDRYFVGPEAPGVLPVLNEPDSPPSPTATRKDDQKRIKRQGARFRVYEYSRDDSGALTGVREITAADAEIEWRVHLANRKAAAPVFPTAPGGNRRNLGIPESDLVIDAGEQTISGASQGMRRLSGTFLGTVTVALGDLLTDGAGRLIVLGGFGVSQSVPPGLQITNFANNDRWCDDATDGPVHATVRLKGAPATVHATPAWVVVSPPDFAPPIQNIISLYDVVWDIAVGLHPSLADPTAAISFTNDVYPILSRVVNTHWVDANARRGHGAGRRGDFLADALLPLLSDNDPSESSEAWDRRNGVFTRIRPPAGLSPPPNVDGDEDMPLLLGGDVPGTLTRAQFRLMERWASGDFIADWTGQPPARPALEQLPAQEQPQALDRAALEACVGAAFFPGIEIGRIMRQPSTYDPALPFRISQTIPPGGLTAGMAVPWQADFVACGNGWWPAQRPNQVLRGGAPLPVSWVPQPWDAHDMIAQWSRLGFIMDTGTGGTVRYSEVERDL